MIGLSKSEIKPPKGGFIVRSYLAISIFFVKLISMKPINARTKIIILLAVLIALIALFGVFYLKNGENVSQPEESNNVPQPEESSSPEESSYEEYLQQGIQYESTNELDKAIDAYQKAAQAKPEAYIPYSNLGSIYERNKEFLKAEEAFKTALSIDPQSISVYRKLYELYRYDLKKPSHEMTPFFSDAFEKTNNDIDLMKLYAFYLEDVNDLESALIVWKAFLQAEPGNEIYAAKVKSLEARIVR